MQLPFQEGQFEGKPKKLKDDKTKICSDVQREDGCGDSFFFKRSTQERSTSTLARYEIVLFFQGIKVVRAMLE